MCLKNVQAKQIDFRLISGVSIFLCMNTINDITFCPHVHRIIRCQTWGDIRVGSTMNMLSPPTQPSILDIYQEFKHQAVPPFVSLKYLAKLEAIVYHRSSTKWV